MSPLLVPCNSIPVCPGIVGSGTAPGSDRPPTADSSITAEQQTATQRPISPESLAEDPASPRSPTAAVSAEHAQSLQAAAEGSANLEAAADSGAAGEDAAVAEEGDEEKRGEDEEDDDSDIELTSRGLLFATTRWDGSRNMTPNRRPTREEREGYIDNEELQEEVRECELPVPRLCKCTGGSQFTRAGDNLQVGDGG